MTLGLIALSGRRTRPAPDASATPAAPGRRALLGTVLGGAGVALALESSAARLRLLGTGLERDDTVFAGVFLALTWLGYVSIPLRAGAARARGGAALTLAAAAALVAAYYLGRLALPDVLWALTRRFDLTLEDQGKLAWNALLAGRCLLVPALALGAALRLHTERQLFGALLTGAAVGLFAYPALVHASAQPLAFDELASASPTAFRIALGTAVAAAGTLLCAAGSARRTVVLPAGLAVAVAAALWITPRPSAWLFAPWYQVEIKPTLTIDAPSGLLTVEYDRDGTGLATLDRRRLTPTSGEERLERQLLRQSLAARDSEDERDILFVGQLSPARAAALRDFGVERVDRTAAWHRHMAAVEDQLFALEPIPRGAILDPIDARAYIELGRYALVLVAPTHGPLLRPSGGSHLTYGSPPSPTLRAAAANPAPVIAWLDGSTLLAQRSLGERLLFAGDGLFLSCVAVVSPAATQALPQSGPNAPFWLEPGSPQSAPNAWSWLHRRAVLQPDIARGHTFARIAANAAGSASSRDFASGLARQSFEQVGPGRGDSPFRSQAEDIFIVPEAIALLARAAHEQPLGAAIRGFFNGLAELLMAKRRPEEIYAHFPTLAEAGAPWPELDHAVGRAASELGLRSEAVTWLERAVAERPYEVGLLLESAEALELADQAAAAADRLEAVLAVQADRPAVRRRLALLQVRAGRAEGAAHLRSLLAEHPEDTELLPFLGEPPFPAPTPGWAQRLATSGGAEEDEHAGHDHD